MLIHSMNIPFEIQTVTRSRYMHCNTIVNGAGGRRLRLRDYHITDLSQIK